MSDACDPSLARTLIVGLVPAATSASSVVVPLAVDPSAGSLEQIEEDEDRCALLL